MPLPTVAIIGRPNVGKSTLFNRLVGRRLALVDDRPGVTRDRREGEGHLADLSFRVIDTAGLEEAPPESLPGRMRAQTERSLDEADVALLLVDAREGITPADSHFARWLHLFSETVAELCPPEAAALFEQKSQMIAQSLQLGIAASRGEIPSISQVALSGD